jgi:hypothetical protein
MREALHAGERAYREATQGVGQARELRARTIAAALQDGMSLRDIAAEIEMTAARVQQIFETLWTHRVGFIGELDDDGANALREAGMALRFFRGGGMSGPQGQPPSPNKHGVYLVADSEEEALARVKNALEGRGRFFTFTVVPLPGKRDSAGN